MDTFDHASELETREREDSIARVRAAAATGHLVTLTCLECGSPIAPERVRALPGVTACIDCATEREHSTRGRNP